MPIHDWSRVEAGIFHDFHQAWTIEIRNALNRGALPSGYFALAEQVISGPIPDVVTLQRRADRDRFPVPGGGIAVADAPPRAAFVSSAPQDVYAQRANRITIQHRLGQVVAVIEIMSPGNKSSAGAMRSFLSKADELLHEGISLLVVDLFPPSPRDPQEIQAIWDQIYIEPFVLPSDKPLVVAAYSAGRTKTAYVDTLAVGDCLPAAPIFLGEDRYISAPLEATYQSTWATCPDAVRELVTDAKSTEFKSE